MRHPSRVCDGMKKGRMGRRISPKRMSSLHDYARRSWFELYVVCRSLENLIQRYEEPSSMVRWDSPLITVLWEDEVPVDQIWKAVMEGSVKPPNAGTQAVS